MSDIKEKIAKLINHANSAMEVGSQAEAETFMAQAHRLMVKYELEMDDLEFEAKQHDEPIEMETVHGDEFGFKKGSRRRIAWVETLAWAVSTAHFCKSYATFNSNQINFVGPETERKQAIRVFLKLMELRDLLGKKAYGELRSAGRFTKGFWSGWNKGFANGVWEKVVAEQRQVRKELITEQKSTALVRLDSLPKRVESWVNENMRLSSAGSSGTNYGMSEAYNRGKSAGRNSSFSTNELK